jgi:peptidoglycan hydrolase FlgJ
VAYEDDRDNPLTQHDRLSNRGRAARPRSAAPARKGRAAAPPRRMIGPVLVAVTAAAVTAAIHGAGKTPPAAAGPGDQVALIAHEAARIHAATGLPTVAVAGQAILESDAGRGRLPREANNYFAIRCRLGPGGQGPVATGCRSYRDAGADATFRTYATPANSFDDYAALITGNPRYRGALARRGDVRGYLAAVQAAGYATDPRYAEHVLAAIRRYHLGAVR